MPPCPLCSAPGSDCEGTDLGGSAEGMQLSVALAPMMEMCAPTPAANAIESAAALDGEAVEPLPLEEQEAQPQAYDEDDAMADMAGLAAAAQDPRTPQAEQPSFRTLPPEDVAPLMDTPTGERWLGWEGKAGDGDGFGGGTCAVCAACAASWGTACTSFDLHCLL